MICPEKFLRGFVEQGKIGLQAGRIDFNFLAMKRTITSCPGRLHPQHGTASPDLRIRKMIPFFRKAFEGVSKYVALRFSVWRSGGFDQRGIQEARKSGSI